MITRSQSGIVKPIDRSSLLTSIFTIPKNPSQALKDPNWRNAMYDKYNAFVKNDTWLLVPRPTCVIMVHSMWLFNHKFHADGTLSHYKARLVANGSNRQLGVDFDETFSPVVKPVTIRMVLSLVVSRQWTIHQLDVKNAFLNGDLSETVYMHQPYGFVDSRYPHHVCLLQRSLYGLKQAPRAWFQRFTGYATRARFYHSRCDSSLFNYRQGSQVSYLLIYVDDTILTASCASLLQQIIGSLNNEFDMTDLRALNYFLGIFAYRSPTGLFLSKKKCALQLIEHAYMVTCNPSRTPVDTESELGPKGAPVQDPTLYRSLAGGLIEGSSKRFNLWFQFLFRVTIVLRVFISTGWQRVFPKKPSTSNSQPNARKQKDTQGDGFQSMKRKTSKCGNWTTSTLVSNAFFDLEEDNRKPMDALVDDTWKKVEAPPKKTTKKLVFGRVRKQTLLNETLFSLLKKVHYFDRDDMEFDDVGHAAEKVEHENAYSKNG
uniref:Ribonuclease H-like domain-containing protein n=1 Tax=Tanacetum cinerariifolium TaxID=118510 RepID=A0A6L2JVZ5_TANCI|nr:ribonuclease H-like domain-containing protein [Tanacetum cinerariifolium]